MSQSTSYCRMASNSRAFPQQTTSHSLTHNQRIKHTTKGSTVFAARCSTSSSNQRHKYENKQRGLHQLSKGLSPEMQQIVSMVKSVECRYDAEQPVFSSREDILLFIKEFLENGVCTKQQLLDTIGITAEEFQSFHHIDGKASDRVVHALSYHWFEKLRIAYNMGKTPRRVRNEETNPKGFALDSIHSKHGHDNMSGLFQIYGGTCDFCGEEGHWKSDCVKRRMRKSECTQSTSTDRGGGTPFSRGIQTHSEKPKDLKRTFLEYRYGSDCFNCGGIGHWASECPNP